MASNIISETIDGAYPVAGIDNDTQGFRDNFTIIKTALSTAQGEITNLQDNTAKLNVGNDFNGTNLSDANLVLTTHEYHNIGTVVSGQNISFLNGHYQSLVVNLSEGVDDINFSLSDWPERDGLARLTLQMYGNGTAKDVTFTVDGGGTIKKSPNYPDSVTVESSDDPIVVEFWTYNQGTTVYANYLGTYTDVIGGAAGTLGDTIIDGDLTVTGNINKPITTTVADLTDIDNVNISNAADGQVLKWNAATNAWINAADSDTTTVIADINDITNVDITSVANGQILVYNSTAGAWENSTNALASSNITADVGGRLKVGIASDNDDVIIEATTGKVTPLQFEAPQFTSSERDGTSGLGETGSLIYNTDDNQLQVYGNGTWNSVLTTAPNASLLKLNPITEAQRDALAAVPGDMIFNNDTQKVQVFVDDEGTAAGGAATGTQGWYDLY
jgi:hypothetical protein